MNRKLTFALLLILIILFFSISLFALFTFEMPFCFAGIPGAIILGYISGDWLKTKLE